MVFFLYSSLFGPISSCHVILAPSVAEAFGPFLISFQWRDFFLALTYGIDILLVAVLFLLFHSFRRLKKTGRELAERSEDLRVTLNSIGDGVITTDRDGKITRLNRIAEQLTGWRLEEARGHPLSEVFILTNAMTGKGLDNPLDQVFERGEPMGLSEETLLTSRQGTTSQIAEKAAPIRNADGEITGVVITFQDVTERFEKDRLLREKDSLHRHVLETLQDAVWDWDPEKDAVTANDAFWTMLGHPPQAFPVSFSYYQAEMLHPDDRDRVVDTINESLEESKSFQYECRLRCRDGSYRWVLTRGHVVETDLEGQPARMLGTNTDITERKRMEMALRDSERLLSEVGRMAQVGGWELDLETQEVTWTSETYRIHEISEDHHFDVGKALLFFDMPQRKDLERAIQDCVEKGIPYDLELPFTTARGNKIWTRAIGRPVREDGKIVKLRGTFQDITVRRKSEEALRVSREHFDLAIQGGDLGTWDWNLSTQKVIYNERWAEMKGYRLEELEPNLKTWENLVHPEDLPRVYEILNAHLVGMTEHYESEFRMRHKSGDWIWILDKGKVIEWDENGRPLRACGTHLDITERKHVEEALRESEVRFQHIASVTTDLIYEWHIDDDRLIWHGGFEKFLGYQPGEIPYTIEGWASLIHPEDAVRLSDAVQRHRTSTEPIKETYRVRCKDGSWRWWEDFGTPMLNADGRPVRWIGGCRDVTERIQAEQAYHAAQAKYREIFEGSRDGFVMVDPRGRFLEVNPAFCEMLGYTVEELKNKDFFEITPESWHRWEQEEIVSKRLLGSGYSGVYEKEYVRKDGTIVPVEIESYCVFDEQGKPEYLWGVARDITERKQSEAAIRESEERFQLVLASVRDAIWDWSPQEGKVQTNDVWWTMIGYEPHEFPVTWESWEALLHPDDREKAVTTIHKAIAEGKPYQIETRLRKKDGSWLWVLTRGIIVETDEDGNPTRLVGSNADISERIEAEQSLRESEERYRTLYEHSPVGILRTRDNRLIEVNAYLAQLFGYESTKEMLDSVPTAYDLYASPVDRDHFLRAAAEMKGKNLQREICMRRRDGSKFWALLFERRLFDREGVYFDGGLIDITEQKAMQQKVADNEARLRVFFETANSAILVFDKDFTIHYANPYALELFGYSADELLEHNIFQRLVPERDSQGHPLHEELREKIVQAHEDKLLMVNENQTKSGERLWMAWTNRFVFDRNGNFVEALAIGNDITELKQNELALQHASEELRKYSEDLEKLVDERTEELNEKNRSLEQTLAHLKKTQSQLIFSEKMATLGHLISGIAHEINTPMGAINAANSMVNHAFTQMSANYHSLGHWSSGENGELFFSLIEGSRDYEYDTLSTRDRRAARDRLIEELKSRGIRSNRAIALLLLDLGLQDDYELYLPLLNHPDAPQMLELVRQIVNIRRGCGIIELAAERAARTVQALKNYAHHDPSAQRSLFDVRESLKMVLMLYQNQIKHRVNIHFDMDEVPDVYAFPDEISQVWMNLIHNALQAMDYHGDLTIEVRGKEQEEEPAVEVIITDTGCGIPREVQGQVFDPFFSTKRRGEGTGLGLDIVRTIVRRHGGQIDFTSTEGEGTSFRVRLPLESDTMLK
jgi:PAS domain S-box-containing protein